MAEEQTPETEKEKEMQTDFAKQEWLERYQRDILCQRRARSLMFYGAVVVLVVGVLIVVAR